MRAGIRLTEQGRNRLWTLLWPYREEDEAEQHRALVALSPDPTAAASEASEEVLFRDFERWLVWRYSRHTRDCIDGHSGGGGRGAL